MPVPLGGGVLRLGRCWLVGCGWFRWLVTGRRRRARDAATWMLARRRKNNPGVTAPYNASTDRVLTNRFGMQFICLLLFAQTEN